MNLTLRIKNRFSQNHRFASNQINSFVWHVVPDWLLTGATLYLSLLLVGQMPSKSMAVLVSFAAIISVRTSVFVASQIYTIMWRYITLHDAVRFSMAQAIASLVLFILSYTGALQGLTLGAITVEALLFLNAALFSRFSRRFLYERRPIKALSPSFTKVLIYGAGTNGRLVAQRYLTGRGESQRPVGFVDDDPEKEGKRIYGIRVLGPRTNLKRIIKNTGANQLVVAIHKPSGILLREVMEQCREFNIRPKLMRGIEDLTSNSQGSHLHREIELSDLLPRSVKKIDLTSTRQTLTGKTILVTGAGGSIGSELCRQIFAFSPRKLILLDHSEYSLYKIDRELRISPSHDSNVVPILADIKNYEQLRQVFAKYSPDVVFHAAAYKHVHLAQNNPCSTILNNILGTKNLIELSKNCTNTFVLISSDKAVNPAGIMGATKRVCELMVTAAGQQTQQRFSSVRFGNVLGSSGSLVPLLKEQIRNGEPITITHQEMKRYFMLIPEAVSLVLKSSNLANPGDIFVLQMDEPVKIIDLSKALRALLGKSNKEAPIIITGLRPGEKLQEELYLTGTERKTEETDIMVIPRGDMELQNNNLNIVLDNYVQEILEKATSGSREALVLVDELVSATSDGKPLSHKFFEGNFENYPTNNQTSNPVANLSEH